MWFTKTFYKHIMFRHSCGNCHFCNTKRPSDITIADFWRWEKTNPEFNKDDKGVSLLLINTEKGRKLWDMIKSDMNYFPAEMQKVMHKNLRNPSKIHPKRMKFEMDYAKKGFEYVYNHQYHDKSLIRRIYIKLKNIIKIRPNSIDK